VSAFDGRVAVRLEVWEAVRSLLVPNAEVECRRRREQHALPDVIGTMHVCDRMRGLRSRQSNA
jgi:hypothetical protein